MEMVSDWAARSSVIFRQPELLSRGQAWCDPFKWLLVRHGWLTTGGLVSCFSTGAQHKTRIQVQEAYLWSCPKTSSRRFRKWDREEKEADAQCISVAMGDWSLILLRKSGRQCRAHIWAVAFEGRGIWGGYTPTPISHELRATGVGNQLPGCR